MRHAREDYQESIVDLRTESPVRDWQNKAIPKDEPVFLLRAQDQFAVEAVKFYAGLVNGHARNEGDVRLYQLCMRHAAIMEEWPKKKFPDTPGVNDESSK